MLTSTSDIDALMARLDAVAPAVGAALSAYVRARRGGVARRQAISAYVERTRPQHLRPDRARVGPAAPPTTGRPSGPSAARLKAVAVRAALQALGRSS